MTWLRTISHNTCSRVSWITYHLTCFAALTPSHLTTPAWRDQDTWPYMGITWLHTISYNRVHGNTSWAWHRVPTYVIRLMRSRDLVLSTRSVYWIKLLDYIQLRLRTFRQLLDNFWQFFGFSDNFPTIFWIFRLQKFHCHSNIDEKLEFLRSHKTVKFDVFIVDFIALLGFQTLFFKIYA